MPGTNRGFIGSVIERPVKASAIVAQQLQALILARKLKPGAKLPAERSLCEQFGVSRTVLREAIKLLAPYGLVNEVLGKGTFVNQPNFYAVRSSLKICLSWHAESALQNLVELRRLIEVEAAGLAAARATKKDIDGLRQNVASMALLIQKGSAKRFAGLDYVFHKGIAQATHNDLFTILLDPLADALVGSWEKMCQNKQVRKRSLQFHKRILAAIERREPREARGAMRASVRCYAHDVETQIEGVSGAP